jgi:hypothetical protein
MITASVPQLRAEFAAEDADKLAAEVGRNYMRVAPKRGWTTRAV